MLAFHRCPFSDSWRLTLRLPACSPRLVLPLPPLHPLLAHTRPQRPLHHLHLTISVFGLLTTTTEVEVGMA